MCRESDGGFLPDSVCGLTLSGHDDLKMPLFHGCFTPAGLNHVSYPSVHDRENVRGQECTHDSANQSRSLNSADAQRSHVSGRFAACPRNDAHLDAWTSPASHIPGSTEETPI